MTGAAMIIMGAAAGFLGGMLNPFTVGVAQQIAEIPLFLDGNLERLFIFVY